LCVGELCEVVMIVGYSEYSINYSVKCESSTLRLTTCLIRSIP
jgi:hypothetical protein